MAPRTRALPKKRVPATQASEDADPPSTKKSKAELRRQSLSRAKEWAADRKRKTAGVVEEDISAEEDTTKKTKPDIVSVDKENEDNEVVKKTTRKSTRRARGTSTATRAALATVANDEAIARTVSVEDDESSVSSKVSVRRSSRRRTMTTKATEAPPVPTRRSRRKTVAPVAPVPEEKPVIEEAPVEIEVEVPVVEEAAEEPIVEEAPAETQVEEPVVEEVITEVQLDESENETADEEETQTLEVKEVIEQVAEEEEEMQEEVEVQPEAVKEKVSEEMAEKNDNVVAQEEKEVVTFEKEVETEAESTELSKSKEMQSEVKDQAEEMVEQPELGALLLESFLSGSPIFLHALVIQWGAAFAIIMMFCLDWWSSNLAPPSEEDILANQQQPCAILGLWVITTMLNFIAFGAKSRIGWVLTGATLAMASLSSKYFAEINGTASIATLPIYSNSGYNVNVLDTLTAICVVGFATTF